MATNLKLKKYVFIVQFFEISKPPPWKKFFYKNPPPLWKFHINSIHFFKIFGL